MALVESQAVLAPITEAAIFLVLTIDAGREDEVRDLLPDVSGLQRSVGFRLPEGELTCVVGIGSDLWDRMFGAPRPAGLHPFRELVGPARTAVSTPGDLLLHLRAHRLDLCFELAQSTASGRSTSATCSASSTAPRAWPARGRRTSSSAMRIRPSRAAATRSCRSTSTTSRHGTG
jgi:putative iron-dependent peroxidase